MSSRCKQSGFTLIEMIVSLGVFSVVITIAVGALLVLIANNQQLQKEQSVMTNLSFVLDSMTREIRTGTFYFCDSRPNRNAGSVPRIFTDSADLDTLDTPPSFATQDCASSRPSNHLVKGVAFVEGGDSITGSDNRILYFFDESVGQLYRKVADNPAQTIVSDGIFITNAEFFVTGSDPLRTGVSETDQPAVTIYIEAVEKNDPAEKSYFIQTTVTQRTLDI